MKIATHGNPNRYNEPMLRWASCLFFIGLFLFCRGAAGEMRVSRVDGGGRADWAMLQVEFPAQPDPCEISVQDARGGMAVVREVPAGVGRTLLPLPLVAPEQLKDQTWSLQAALDAGGRTIEQTSATVKLGSEDVYRVAVAAGTPEALLQAVDWQVLTARRVVFVPLPADAYAAPPLLFAGCDAVITSASAPIEEARQRAIIAAGARIISVTEGRSAQAPPGNTWVWEQLGSSDAAAAWIVPTVPIGRPMVIEPGLADLALPAPAPPRGLIAATLLTGPVAIVAVLLMRGLCRRPRHIMLAAGLALGGVAGGFAAYVRGADATVQRQATVHLASARSDAATGAVFIDEQICSRVSFVDQAFSVEANGVCLTPIAPTARAYFARHDVRLVLDHASARLEERAHGREALYYATRAARPGGTLPAFPTRAEAQLRLAQALGVDPAAARWVSGGYVFAANTLPDHWQDGALFTAWAKTQPEGIRQAAQVWDALHADASHRYFMWQEDQGLSWIDYGRVPTGP